MSMKTRLICFGLVLSCISVAALAAQDAKWKSIPFRQWGFSLKVPANAAWRPLGNRPASGACDVYAAGGLAYVVQVTPASSDALASTAIEQAIQAEVKNASTLGSAARWETTSKKGDLFKGFTGQLQLNKSDAAQSVVIKTIGAERAVQSVAMAPLGDETAPVLRIAVVGTPNRENEVVAMAKEIAALVTTGGGSQPLIVAPRPSPKPEPVAPMPVPMPSPMPAAKPWPALKSGQIELVGTVDSVSKDGKIVMMTIDTVKVIGQDPITLSPTRPKKVLLKSKMGWLMRGQYVHLIGKNSGEGKPIQADAMEQMPASAPPPEKPHPIPLSQVS